MPWAVVSLGVSSAKELVDRIRWLTERFDDRVLIEARLDYLGDPLGALDLISPFSSRLVITYRRPEEGGASKTYSLSSAKKVLEKAKALGPRFIDVELRTLKELRFSYEGLIASVHYMEGVPSEERMLSDSKAGLSSASLAKVVLYPKSFSEAVMPLALYKILEPGRLVAFSAGEEWKFTRFLALSLGSPLIYCSLPGGSVAPGQPTVEEALKLMEAIL